MTRRNGPPDQVPPEARKCDTNASILMEEGLGELYGLYFSYFEIRVFFERMLFEEGYRSRRGLLAMNIMVYL